MFKLGDKVIFIGDDSCIVGIIEKYEHKLLYGGEYIIYHYDKNFNQCLVTESNTPVYTVNGFVSLKQYLRKQKLQKICLNQEIE